MTPWGKKRTFGRAKDARECETGRQWPSQRSKPWQRHYIAPPSPHQVLERPNPVLGTQPGLSKECAEATRAPARRREKPWRVSGRIWPEVRLGRPGERSSWQTSGKSSRVQQAGSVRGRLSLLRQSFMVCASHALSYLSSELWGRFICCSTGSPGAALAPTGRKRCDQDLTGATEWRLIRVGV